MYSQILGIPMHQRARFGNDYFPVTIWHMLYPFDMANRLKKWPHLSTGVVFSTCRNVKCLFSWRNLATENGEGLPNPTWCTFAKPPTPHPPGPSPFHPSAHIL